MKRVRFDREKFQNLDQLDRIEYMLAEKNLRDRYSGSITFSMIWTLFYCWGFLMILSLLMYIGFGSVALFDVWTSLAVVSKWALIASLIMDVVVTILQIKRRKRLNDHFLKRGGYI